MRLATDAGRGNEPGLANPGLTSPAGVTPGWPAPTLAPSEVPIDPTGLDPGADGTYPILGDPSTFGGGGSAGSDRLGGGGTGGGPAAAVSSTT